MTYRREAGSWAEATTRALQAGQELLAEHLGVSPSRLRQCSNPVRSDSLPLHLACAADIACAKAGIGTPLFDAYRRRLIEAGAIRIGESQRDASRLRTALRAAAALIHAALAGECGDARGVAA